MRQFPRSAADLELIKKNVYKTAWFNGLLYGIIAGLLLAAFWVWVGPAI